MRVMGATHLFGALSLGIGLAFAVSPSVAAPTCPAVPPTITLDMSATEPVIDNSVTQPALQTLAAKVRHRGRAQGLYLAEFTARTHIGFARASQGGVACLWIDKLALDVAVADRKIYIVKKRVPGTCAYDAVLVHERKHQRVDDDLLREQAPLIRQAIEQALAALPAPSPVPPAEESAVRTRLAAAVQTALERALKTLDAERKVRQAAIDTPQEYRRVGAACG